MGKLKSRERAKGKGEGTKKKVVKIAKGEAGKSSASSRKEEGAKPFSRPQIFSRPKDLQMLFQAFREGEVGAQILRPRLQTESVEHGRGTGVLRNFSFRRFKDEPKAVLYINAPRSKAGGSFEPTDRLLNPGEQIRLTYSAPVEGSSGPVYFLAKGFFLRKSFLIPNDPMNDGKPWSGTREEAAAKFSKDLVINGDDVLELRIDTVNSFPGGPGRTDRMVLDRYLSESKLYIIPGGGGWNQKSTQGNFFDGVRRPPWISTSNARI